MLPIQGPPGTGKTFTGSHMILELVKAGKKVGVTAVGHETIRNVLRAVCEHAASQGLTDFQCLHKGKPKDDNPEALHAIDDNDRIAQLFATDAYRLLGGTAWCGRRPDFEQSVDVLFVDEAGQMSLANVLAVARRRAQPGAARRPAAARAAAAERATRGQRGASALYHVLDGEDTMPADKGLFLHRDAAAASGHREVHVRGRSTRARSSSFPGLERQAMLRAGRIDAVAARQAPGSCYVPVAHDGQSGAIAGRGRGDRDARRAPDEPTACATTSDDEEAPLTQRRPHDRRAVQRAGHGARGAAARRCGSAPSTSSRVRRRRSSS